MSAEGGETVIVDGYNLIRRGFSFLEVEHGLAAAREKLEVRLREHLRAVPGLRLVVVYDGSLAAPGPEAATSEALQVLFSRRPQTADELVLEESRRWAARGPVTVVSSDLKDIARRLDTPGVRHRSSEDFAEDLDQALSLPGRGRAPSGKRAGGEKPSPEDISPSETEKWLRIFSKPKEDPGQKKKGGRGRPRSG